MPYLIGLLVVALRWLVITGIAQWAVRLLVAFGVGLATTTVGLPALKTFVMQRSNALGGFLYQTFGAIGGDVAFGMILSAYAAAFTGKLVFKALKK